MSREEQIERLAAVIEEDTECSHIAARRAARRILDLGALEVVRVPTKHFTTEEIEALQSGLQNLRVEISSSGT